MREKPGVGGEEPGADTEPRKKRLDLSVPQVAGSAVAAVVAAKLASYFGVYGTILGAGLVSVVATSGGTLFQHFFKRTGEQIREVQPKRRPRPQQVSAAAPVGASGEFTEGTVYRARVRSWKRPLVATALVFGVTMTGITTYELVSGQSFSGDGTSTTVGDAFKGHGSGSGGSGSGSGTTPSPAPSSSSTPRSPEDQAPSTGGDGSASREPGSGDATTSRPAPDDGASSDPATGDGTPTPDPSTTATTPAPSASSHSQSADPGRADSGAP